MFITYITNKLFLPFCFLLIVYSILLIPVKAVNPAPLSCVENNSTTVHNPKALVIDFNPNINNNGTVTDLRSYMKTIDTRTFPIGTTGTRESGWGDPLNIAEDFKDVIYDVSDQKVNYSIVDTLRITQTDGVGLINGTPGVTNVEQVGFSQDRFLQCWQLKNNPEANYSSNLTTNKTTLSKSSPHSGGATKQTLEANKVIEGACKLKSVNYSENDFWISHRIRTTVNGLEQISYEYILESDASTLPSDFPMCNMCNFEVDIVKLAEDKDLCGKINRGEIDEVWFFGPKYGIKADYAGGIENALISSSKDIDLYASHGNFRLDLCDTPMPFTVSNYEGGKYGIANYSLMHYSGHRMEYYLTNYMYQRDVYNRTTGKNTVDWTKYNSNLANFGYLLPTYSGDRFALESKSWLDGALNATTAGCGTTHADPLSTDDYRHAVPGTKNSSCWDPVTNLGYNLTGIRSTVDITNQEIEYSCNLWGCTSEGWQKFWFDKVPSNEGASKELLNDWWTYYLDPEKAKVKYADKSACTCPSGYMYNSTTQQCEVFSCTNPSNSCAIQNLSGKPVCEISTGLCVECTQNSQCPSSKNWCRPSNTCYKCRGVISGDSCLSCESVNSLLPRFDDTLNSCTACIAGTVWDGNTCLPAACTLDLSSYQSKVFFTPSSVITTDSIGGIATDKFGNIYVSEFEHNLIRKYDVNGVSSVFGSTANKPSEIVVDSYGNVYSANWSNPGSVTKITSNGTVTTFPLSPNMKRIVVDVYDNVYAAGDGGIYKITPSGNFSIFSSSVVINIAVDNNGILYATTGYDILKFDSAGNPATIYTSPAYIGFVAQLETNSVGELYLLHFGSPSSIGKLSTTGVYSVKVASIPSLPNSLYVSKDDSLFYTISESLVRISSSGTVTNFGYQSVGTNPSEMLVDITGNIFISNTFPIGVYKLSRNVLGNCQVCPSELPFYDTNSKSCQSCPVGLTYNPLTYQCSVPSCLNGMIQCSESAPVCSTAGACVVCESNLNCGGATPVCENNQCVHCSMYDTQNGNCSPPSERPGAEDLYWDGNAYVAPTCSNGGISCEIDGKVCDPETSACVECVSNTQCKDSTKPICDGDTRACIGCPTDKPVFGAVYHYSQNYEGYISSISEPTNEVLTLQSISSSGEDQIFSENLVHVTYECQACPLGSTWDGVKCQAADCRSGNSCSSGLVCNTNNGDCVQCMSSSDCGESTPICESNSCRRCPSTAPYLDTTDNMCKACPAGLTWFNGKCLSDEQLILEVYTSYDKDADQLFDPSKDMGISNVGVTLKGVTYDGTNVMQYEETDIDGKVVFSNLIPGNYELEQIQPLSFSDKTIFGVSSENLISENQISNVELFANTSTPIVFMEGGWKVEGKVYLDKNNDGQFNVGEEILTNVKVKLVGENLTKETLTDSSGNYYFDNLVNGDYTLTEVQPLGYVTGIENSSNQVSININSSNKVVNFGENELSVTVYTLIDLDNSGTITEGDIPMYNTTVKLTGMDVLGGTIMLEKQTGIDGKVVFDSLLEGSYSISEVQPQTVTDGPEVVGNLGGTVGTDAINGIILNNDAIGYAFLEYGWKLSGKVFVDIDKDNVIDLIDVGVAGVKLTLNNQSITLPYNAKILGVTSFVATTDNAGNYFFDNMPNGNYTLTQDQPSAYLTNNSNVIAIVISSSNNSSNNFSELGGKIGGVVFDDLNGNGIRDTSEQYISNLEVLLLDKNGSKYSTTLTDASGAFIFNGLPAGTYTLSIPSIKYNKVITINPAEEVLGINVGKFTDLPKTGRDWILFKFIKVY